jgi:D-glycero-D-manno-heptose 1,7-bisphosphate phosphatase
MGTPQRFLEAEADIQNGVPARRNLSRRQKAIFLDRDGTLNVLRERQGAADGAEGPQQQPLPFITSPEGLTLIDGAADAVRLINDAGLLAIVITNQPVIARGQCSFETLETIHQKLETELGKSGAFINDLYFCPHHPAKGFDGEVAALKIDCACRKPRPGMILQAAEKYNIDLHESWMVGDALRDIEAGKNAGCKTAYIDYDGKESGADITAENLLDAVRAILAREEPGLCGN